MGTNLIEERDALIQACLGRAKATYNRADDPHYGDEVDLYDDMIEQAAFAYCSAVVNKRLNESMQVIIDAFKPQNWTR